MLHVETCTVGVNKKFPVVSHATEWPLPFRCRSNPVYFPFTCRLTSDLFRSIVIKRLFRSVPLCQNDRSAPFRCVETIIPFRFFFWKQLLPSLFWSDRSLRWNNHSLRWNDCSLCWHDHSIRCLKTFVHLFKQSFLFVVLKRLFILLNDRFVRCLETIIRCLETIVRCLETIVHCFKMIVPLCWNNRLCIPIILFYYNEYYSTNMRSKKLNDNQESSQSQS